MDRQHESGEDAMTRGYREDYSGEPLTREQRPARLGNLLYVILSEQKADKILNWIDKRKTKGKHTVDNSPTQEIQKVEESELNLKAPTAKELEELTSNALSSVTIEVPTIKLPKHSLEAKQGHWATEQTVYLPKIDKATGNSHNTDRAPEKV